VADRVRYCICMDTKTPARSKKLQPTGLPALLSVEQVADATGMSHKTIRRRVADNTLRAHRIGPRLIRIERDSVLELLRSPISAAT
jgi:excisionase family DNA binding protein